MSPTPPSSPSPVTPASILIVHPDAEVRKDLAHTLQREAWTIHQAGAASAALVRARDTSADLLLTAAHLPDMSGVELARALRRAGKDVEALLVIDASDPDPDLEAAAHELGVFDVLPVPLRAEVVERSVAEALEVARLRRVKPEDRPVPVALDAEPRLVGTSPGMLAVRHRIALFAPTDLTVLIVGESGTGKELVARAIHARSRRSGNRFEAVRLGSLPPTLAESELYGHSKGAFTGADRAHRGCFERAGQGTVFLDEIGDLPQEVQPKLLAVLQQAEFTPVGGETVMQAGARVIAATHRDLRARVRDQGFRQDLYYRLNQAVIRLPPLRERMEDLEPLIDHLVARAAAAEGVARIPTLSADALHRLRQHTWPGNVRELENCLRRAVVLATRGVICPSHLEIEAVDVPWDPGGSAAGAAVPEPSAGPRTSRSARSGAPPAAAAGTPSAPWVGPEGTVLTMAEVARQHIKFTLKLTEANLSQAARLLGVPASTLRSRMEALGLKRKRRET